MRLLTLILLLPLFMTAQSDIYTIDIKGIDGSKLDLSKYKGKHILIVNVASECGFTKQYTELQELHEKHGDKIAVIGFPCNQFGGQEPGTEEEIQGFCTKNFGVTFPLSSKLEVKGENQHALYKYLCNKSENGKMDATVKWNFHKFLIDPNGQLISDFGSATKPLSEKILDHLK